MKEIILVLMFVICLSSVAAFSAETISYTVGSTNTGYSGSDINTSNYEGRFLLEGEYPASFGENTSYDFDPGYFEPYNLSGDIVILDVGFNPYPVIFNQDTGLSLTLNGTYTDILVSVSINNGPFTNYTPIVSNPIIPKTYLYLLSESNYDTSDVITQKWFIKNSLGDWAETNTYDATVRSATGNGGGGNSRETVSNLTTEEPAFVEKVKGADLTKNFIIIGFVIFAFLIFFTNREKEDKMNYY